MEVGKRVVQLFIRGVYYLFHFQVVFWVVLLVCFDY